MALGLFRRERYAHKELHWIGLRVAWIAGVVASGLIDSDQFFFRYLRSIGDIGVLETVWKGDFWD